MPRVPNVPARAVPPAREPEPSFPDCAFPNELAPGVAFEPVEPRTDEPRDVGLPPGFTDPEERDEAEPMSPSRDPDPRLRLPNPFVAPPPEAPPEPPIPLADANPFPRLPRLRKDGLVPSLRAPEKPRTTREPRFRFPLPLTPVERGEEPENDLELPDEKVRGAAAARVPPRTPDVRELPPEVRELELPPKVRGADADRPPEKLRDGEALLPAEEKLRAPDEKLRPPNDDDREPPPPRAPPKLLPPPPEPFCALAGTAGPAMTVAAKRKAVAESTLNTRLFMADPLRRWDRWRDRSAVMVRTGPNSN